MNTPENPKFTPQQYKVALVEQLNALRKIRKIYRKKVLAGSILYHTSLRNVNKQIAEVFDELIVLEKNNPDLSKTLLSKFTDNFEELAKAAAGAQKK